MEPPQIGLNEACNWHQGGGLPTWLLSLMLHCAALMTIGLALPTEPQGAASEPVRTGGIVLVARSGGKADYFADEPHHPALAASFETQDVSQPPTAGPRLPTPPGLLSAAPVAASVQLPSAAALGSPTMHHRPPGHGQASAVEAQVFGVRGKGTRFVYVFDRSSSMEGGPLIAAKRELIVSLQSLSSVHQFQIIFYNQEPQLMNLRGQSPQMAFGDEPGKALAARFVGGISAYGATDHMQALQMALRMRPDVIFFLTDADEPQLRTGDFQKLRQWNQGTSINAIEFGLGPRQAQFNFLQQLAAENGGQHAYVDIARLVR